MANFTRNGYGQVEPNQLSAQKTGQIYASLPLASDVKVLQNGEFMYYNYAEGEVKNEGVGEPMLVFNEIKLYEDAYRTTYKDFAMIRVGDNYVTSALATAGYGDGAETLGATVAPHAEYGYRMDGIAPRLLKTNVGDIYTTNMVKTGVEYSVGEILIPNKDASAKTLVLGFDSTDTTHKKVPAAGMAWQVVKVYTMPDGQPGLKLQRVQ